MKVKKVEIRSRMSFSGSSFSFSLSALVSLMVFSYKSLIVCDTWLLCFFVSFE